MRGTKADDCVAEDTPEGNATPPYVATMSTIHGPMRSTSTRRLDPTAGIRIEAAISAAVTVAVPVACPVTRPPAIVVIVHVSHCVISVRLLFFRQITTIEQLLCWLLLIVPETTWSMGVDNAAEKATKAPRGVGRLPLARVVPAKKAGCLSRLRRQKHRHESNQVVRRRVSPPRPSLEHLDGQKVAQAILDEPGLL